LTTWNLTGMRHHVLICNGGSCMRRGGEEVTQAVREEVKRLGLDPLIHTTRTRCNGRCEEACALIVYPQGVWYKAVTPEIATQIVQQHLRDGEIVQSHLMYTYEEQGLVPTVTSEGGVEKAPQVKRLV
jgi:(2Fe-2S) ferredoxin